MQKISKFTTIAAICCAIGLGISGCSTATSAPSDKAQVTSSSDVSRARLYNGLAEISGDSNLVVTGTVLKEEIVTDVVKDAPVLKSTFEIKTVLAGAVPGGKSTVVVRMYTGSFNQDKSNVLKVGSDYLLFLTDSGLNGNQASQYYVTGYEAGAYVADSTTDGVTTYKRLIKTEGDVLPATLTEADVAKN